MHKHLGVVMEESCQNYY